MTVLDIAATVVIGGVTQVGVQSVRRIAALTRVSQQFTITLKAPTTPIGVDPSEVTTITENGVLVLTGYVDTITYTRNPEANVIIEGRDTFKLAEDYFIDDYTLRTNGESAAYWVDKICVLCGLSYTISGAGGSLSVGQDVPVGLVLAVEALRGLCAAPGWNMRVTAAGVLEFFIIPDAAAADEMILSLYASAREVGDALTRNVAKIWGFSPLTGEALLYQERRVIAGIVPDRIMAVGSSNITTLADATSLATSLLDHFAQLDQVSSFTTPGAPARQIGQIIEATAEPGHTQRSPLTDMESTSDLSGYNQAIAIGRKNFLLPYFNPIIGDGVPLPDTFAIFRNFLGADSTATAPGAYSGYMPTASTPASNLTAISNTPTLHAVPIVTTPTDANHGILTTASYAFFWTNNGHLHRFNFATLVNDDIAVTTGYPPNGCWCIVSDTTACVMLTVGAYPTGTFELKRIDFPSAGVTSVVQVPITATNSAPAWMMAVFNQNATTSILWDEKDQTGAGGATKWTRFRIHSYNLSTLLHTTSSWMDANAGGEEIIGGIGGSPPRTLGFKLLFWFCGSSGGATGDLDPSAGSRWDACLYTLDYRTLSLERLKTYSVTGGANTPKFNHAQVDYKNSRIYISANGLFNTPVLNETNSLVIVSLPVGGANGPVTEVHQTALAAVGLSAGFRIVGSKTNGICFINNSRQILDENFAILGTISGSYTEFCTLLDDVGARVWTQPFPAGNLLRGTSIIGAAERLIDLGLLTDSPLSIQGNRFVNGYNVIY